MIQQVFLYLCLRIEAQIQKSCAKDLCACFLLITFFTSLSMDLETFHVASNSAHFPASSPTQVAFLKFLFIWWVLSQHLIGFIWFFPSTGWSPLACGFLPFEFSFSGPHFLHQFSNGSSFCYQSAEALSTLGIKSLCPHAFPPFYPVSQDFIWD